MKNGVYKLKKRIKNTSGCTNHRLWTSCAHIPPADEEWDGGSGRSPERFFIVVQDVEIMGRTYREAVLQNGYMTTGFFIGEVPSKEHFPGFTDDDMAEFVTVFQDHSDEPAPKEFLDALVPVKGKTLEDVFRGWAKYKGIDPRIRLDPAFWANTALAVVDHGCRNDPDFMRKFKTGLRRLLLRDSHVNLCKDHVLYTDGEVDTEKTLKHQKKALEDIKETNLQQYRALMNLDSDARARGEIDEYD